MKMSSVFLAVSCLTSLALPAWSAGSVDDGRLYYTRCQSCHSDPTVPAIAKYRFDAAGFGTFLSGHRSGLSAQAVSDLASFIAFPYGNDTDRLLDWGEDTFPQLLSPRRQPTQQLGGYTYRYYSATGFYFATKDGNVWYYDSRAPGAGILGLGSIRSFLDQMPNDR